jgi:hypothetical protein
MQFYALNLTVLARESENEKISRLRKRDLESGSYLDQGIEAASSINSVNLHTLHEKIFHCPHF